MSELLDKIAKLAGEQRRATFLAAAEFILKNDISTLIETGCYRGCDADGESTLILATLAKDRRGRLISIDIDPEHIKKAEEHVAEYNLKEWVWFAIGDSVKELSLHSKNVHFAYLDSYDHDPKNPGPCQRHELAEIGAIYGKLVKPCGLLLDDNVKETGGKPLLGAAFLKDRGWKLVAEGYQLFFTRE